MNNRIFISVLAVLTLAGCKSEQATTSVNEIAATPVISNVVIEEAEPIEVVPAATDVIDELIAAIEQADELPVEEVSTSSPEPEPIDETNDDDWVESDVESYSTEIAGSGATTADPCEVILERLDF